MAIHVLPYPGCCTARVLTGFTQSNTAMYGRGDPVLSVEAIKGQVTSLIRLQVGRHCGLVTATVTSTQVNAIQALTELGFEKSDALPKGHHPETSLFHFWINPAKFLDEVHPIPKKVGLVKNLKPRALREYKDFLRLARTTWSQERAEGYRESAALILSIRENFIEVNA